MPAHGGDASGDIAAVARVIEHAVHEGCPVAMGDANGMAAYAVRRMRTFDRRARKSRGRVARANDLAKGLVDRFEPEPAMVGPLAEHYRYLAGQILDAYERIPWERACSAFPVGAVVRTKVAKAVPFGVFVSLPGGHEIPGLIVLPNLDPAGAVVVDVPLEGSAIEAIVTWHHPGTRQIWLSRRLEDYHRLGH